MNDVKVPPADDSADLDDIAWRGYHDAFRLLLAGEKSDALALLKLLLQRYPTHPSAAMATQVTRLLEAPEKGVAVEATTATPGPSDGPATTPPWQSYHAVFVALAQGLAPTDARARLNELAARWPDSAAARRSRSLAALATPLLRPRPEKQAPPKESIKPFGPSQAASEWYGGVLVVVDAITLGITGLGRLVKSTDVLALGLALNTTDGLVVHTYSYPPSRRGTGIGKGFLSLLLRGGLGVGLCATSRSCFHQTIGDDGLVRMVIGLAIADAIDATFLARRRVEPDQPASLEVAPVAFAAPQGAQMGLVARW